jgi:hypothetical protein
METLPNEIDDGSGLSDLVRGSRRAGLLGRRAADETGADVSHPDTTAARFADTVARCDLCPFAVRGRSSVDSSAGVGVHRHEHAKFP